MDEPLALEWVAYRAACDAVDTLRGHPVFGDPEADPEKRLRLTERLLLRRRAAVAASERLIGRAEREPGIDPAWLAEMREEHDALLRATARGERRIAQGAILA